MQPNTADEGVAEQENAEPSTSLSHPKTVEARVKTEEPLICTKAHEYTDRETQTDFAKRKQSLQGNGPSLKRKQH